MLSPASSWVMDAKGIDEQSLLKHIEKMCDYKFQKLELLVEAFTHDSHRVNDRNKATYQRLEFLGDSILQFVISDYLYRQYPTYAEGKLTEERKTLTEGAKQKQIGDKLQIKQWIHFGQSVQVDNYKKYDSFVESLIGAIYIDGGLQKTRQVIFRLWDLVEPTVEIRTPITPSATESARPCILS